VSVDGIHTHGITEVIKRVGANNHTIPRSDAPNTDLTAIKPKIGVGSQFDGCPVVQCYLVIAVDRLADAANSSADAISIRFAEVAAR